MQLRKAFRIPLNSANAMASDIKDRFSDMGMSPDKSGCYTDDESSGTEACHTPGITTLAPNSPVDAEPAANTKAADITHQIELLASQPKDPDGPDKPIATYELVWHYDHNPVFVPREITRDDSGSDSKEIVQIYKMQALSTKSHDETDSSDGTSGDDTHPPTHRAEVRLFRNNEKRVTFGCRFNAGYEVLTDVSFIKSESIFADGTRWHFFEDSRRLEDLDLRLRDERDENGYYYIEFIVRQKSHRDSSDMPHLTVLGRRVVGDAKPLEIAEEEALRLVRRKTPEPYEIEEASEIDDVTESEEDVGSGEITDIEEGYEIDETPELDDLGGVRFFSAEW